MHRIYTVSFPRSGHYLLTWILEAYFGDEFVYCDNFQHCTQIPCKNPLNNYHKNHDFGLDAPILPGENYLIQLRHPYESIASWFELDLPKEGQAPFEDSRKQWESWLFEKLEYWRGFVHKWVFGPQPMSKQVLLYHDLTDSLYFHVEGVIQAMKPGAPIDHKKLGQLLERRLRNEVRDVHTFRYFDSAQLRTVEMRVADLLLSLEIPSLGRGPGQAA